MPLRLLVLVPKDCVDEVSRRVDALSGLAWRGDHSIIIPYLPDTCLGNSRGLTALARQVIKDRADSTVPRVVVLSLVGKIAPERLPSSVALVQHVSAKVTLLRRSLPEALGILDLDWFASVSARLRAAWQHADVDQERVTAWLRQFEALGNRWIGECLLKQLDLWSPHRIATALGLDRVSSRHDSSHHVCVNRRVGGKSADAIANLARKRLGTPTINDLSSSLEDPECESVLFLEDCLLTGTEMTRALREILGEPPTRQPKSRPVEHPERLKGKSVTFRFAVIANWGATALARVLEDASLDQMYSIDRGNTCTRIELLSAAGLEACKAGTLLAKEDHSLVDESHVISQVFRDHHLWGTAEKLERARTFLWTIGKQLIQAYLGRQGWGWSDRRMAQAGLGVYASGLTLVFYHSIPKETLPVFWARGNVVWKSKSLSWEPLFANAE